MQVPSTVGLVIIMAGFAFFGSRLLRVDLGERANRTGALLLTVGIVSFAAGWVLVFGELMPWNNAIYRWYISQSTMVYATGCPAGSLESSYRHVEIILTWLNIAAVGLLAAPALLFAAVLYRVRRA